MPKYPECWEICGSCASGEVYVLEVRAKPGDHVRQDDIIITLETGKVALDIPTPHAGRVLEVGVAEGEAVPEGAVIRTLEPA